jgi:hypothetical protein
VLAREAVLSDPRIVEVLAKHFVCFAIDNANNSNTTKLEREFLAPLGGRASTQGMSTFTAGGQLLSSGGGYDAEPNLKMLHDALSKFQSDDKFKNEPPPIVAPDAERDAAPQDDTKHAPEGGLVLYVTWKVLTLDKPQASPTTGGERYVKEFQNSVGVDRLWVRKDEADALAQGVFPASLRRRLAPYLRYVLPSKLKSDELQFANGRLTGALLDDTGDRADTLGFVEVNGGRVTRFDLIIKGLGVHGGDHGFEGPLTAVPKGTSVPVALGFMLADPADDLSRTLPHRARDPQYLK